MKLKLTLLFGLLPFLGLAQLTWSNGAAELFYENCTACHNSNGIAPFDLMTYEDVSSLSGAIEAAVESDYMPPWTADNTYQSYAHSRELSEQDKLALLSWISDEMPVGNEAEIPPPPVYSNQGFIQASADIELEMEEYTSNASSFQDDYVCISLPTGLTEDKKLKAYEVIPGNPSILHHCLVYIDETGNYQSDFSGVCGGPSNDVGLIGGYTPGAQPTVFPSNGDDVNMGITVPAGSNLILAMHYPHGSAGETDQTKIRLYFYEDDVEIREVTTYPIIQNWGFNIEANTQEEVTAQQGIGFEAYSVLSVFPHMHLLGEYIQSYAVSPDDEVIPLVKVNHWDFEWQEFYFFDQIQVIPPLSTIYGNGTYNNTSDNPHNPNDPPQDVGAGLNTSDEMFLVYFHYLPYEEGDEDLDMTELTSLPTDMTELDITDSSVLNVYPNPGSDEITFSFSLENAANTSLYIYDVSGKIVDKVLRNEVVNSGVEEVIWDVNQIKAGAYYYSVMIDGVNHIGKLLVE